MLEHIFSATESFVERLPVCLPRSFGPTAGIASTTLLLRKRRSIRACLVTFLLLSLSLVACGPSDRTRKLQQDALSVFGPIPDHIPGAIADPNQIALGAKLFSDPILSIDRTVSCASCHPPAAAGVDRRRVSKGIRGQEGTRNAPTVFNAGLHIAQFWDGRAKDLQEQAGRPILNPVEMGMPDEAVVIERLRQNSTYPGMFQKAFREDPNPVTYANMTRAIATFEQTLLTSDRFDRFQKGDLNALTGRELKGLQLFMELGCVSCHNGALLGGNSFRRLGGVRPYENITDTGRFALTGIEADRFVFKVPSLRNVGVTGPYFHDGAVPVLENAIQTMANVQLGRSLNRLQVAYLADFLRTLTDPRFAEGKK